MKDLVNEIHEEAFIIDAHFDLLFDVVKQRETGRTKVIETDHVPNFRKSGFNLIISSIFVDDAFNPEMVLHKALNQVSALYAEIDESPDEIMLCKSYEDVMEAKRTGKVGIMLSFEGVEPLYNDLSLLRVFYELGVRFVGLTWSRRNFAADGCHFTMEEEDRGGGLTKFGEALVTEAERLGMIIDVTHINDRGFEDVFRFNNGTIIASHSDAREVTETPRNLTDNQLKRIASRGGVAGINVVSLIASGDANKGDVNILVDHIEHMKKTVGIDYIGLGLDCCDALYKYLTDAMLNQMEDRPFDIISHAELKTLTEKLLERGFEKEEIIQIYGGNYLRVYGEVLRG
ncbi:dipeptidase [Halalkalibacillus halophilus]|uniref:dipeptidase n=1 Tax=Halalkalibacillus halophilus TaxID=392827 RepID=UPI0003FAE510|nr:membrane dipeptidase [Halalkalibacillus halophilus]